MILVHDFDETVQQAQASAPYHFLLVDRLPGGEAPEGIRRQWVGIWLPVRYPWQQIVVDRSVGNGLPTKRVEDVDGGIVILLADGIAALERDGRHGAAVYWGVRAMTGSRALVFDPADGAILSVDDARRLRDDLCDVA
jgi:hypothetical protein